MDRDTSPMDRPTQLEMVDAELKKRQGPSLSIAVAVDGSAMSDKAMSAGLVFHNNRRGDQFRVLHVSDASKTYLSKHLQPAHLKNYYLDMAHGARVKAEWACREKEEGLSTCESLTRLADKQHTDLLVLGSWGRKGEKLDMLGTVSDFSLRSSHSSICIVRSTGSAAITQGNRPVRYLFSSDGSHAAHLAFCLLTNYLMRPSDSVVAVMVCTTDGTDEEKRLEQYRTYMEKRKISGKALVKCVDRVRSSIPEGIVDAVAENECDALVLGISGYGRKKLGSVSQDVSSRATCTTIIIKDSREIMASVADPYLLAKADSGRRASNANDIY